MLRLLRTRSGHAPQAGAGSTVTCAAAYRRWYCSSRAQACGLLWDALCYMAPYAGQAMELLGPSLWDEWNSRGAGSMPVPFVACVAVEALRILEGLHERGCALCSVPQLPCMESPCVLMLNSLGVPSVTFPWTLSFDMLSKMLPQAPIGSITGKTAMHHFQLHGRHAVPSLCMCTSRL